MHIDSAACRTHFHEIAPGFRDAKGLIGKHFIWSESGWAGGVYQWETLEEAKEEPDDLCIFALTSAMERTPRGTGEQVEGRTPQDGG